MSVVAWSISKEAPQFHSKHPYPRVSNNPTPPHRWSIDVDDDGYDGDDDDDVVNDNEGRGGDGDDDDGSGDGGDLDDDAFLLRACIKFANFCSFLEYPLGGAQTLQ